MEHYVVVVLCELDIVADSNILYDVLRLYAFE